MTRRLLALLAASILCLIATYCRPVGDCIAYFLAGNSFYWLFVGRHRGDR